MRIPKYWAKGIYTLDDHPFIAWKWSDTSLAEAQKFADDKAREIALKFENRQQLDRYAYGRNPLREEVTQSIKNANGKEIGVITRNLYGALVLNAANAMFVDIDFPDKSATPKLESTCLQAVDLWAQANRNFSLRIYRTFGGLRCLITNEIFDPTQPASLALMQNLQSDKLYVTLCRQQESFRARLTPKPWRCGSKQPPSRFPWDNMREEHVYREWERAYQQASSRFTVCRLVKEIGNVEIHPDVKPILSLHDDIACANSKLDLA